MYTIATDTGGTFTDSVLRTPSGQIYQSKTLTDHVNPAQNLLQALEDLARVAQMDLTLILQNTQRIIHGTTLALNSVLEQKTSPVALLTTYGFRDALEIRRSRLPDQWNLHTPPPMLLVPRHRRLGILERVDYQGAVIHPLDESQAMEMIERIRGMQVDAVAVCFLFSVLNPIHEQRMGQLLQQYLPEKHIVLSSDVAPRIREYARTTTTVINASMAHLMKSYLQDLLAALQEKFFCGKLELMINDGGVTTTAYAEKVPARLLFSGPAGGARGGESIARQTGLSELLVADMGGTSFDVHLISRGQSGSVNETELAGLPISMSVLDIQSVGAGGGSIAKVNSFNFLTVGPESAGANPGPACYGFGGNLPTITDALLLKGLLDGHHFCDGRYSLEEEPASHAIDQHVAKPLSMTIIEAADAIYRVSAAKMADVIRVTAVKYGKDPRGLTILSAGGAFPLFVAEIMRELGIKEAIIPNQAPTFCAWGMLHAPRRHEEVQSVILKKSAWTAGRLTEAIDLLRQASTGFLINQGVKAGDFTCHVKLEMRYIDQHHEIAVDLPTTNHETLLSSLDAAFQKKHQELYGYATKDKDWEVVTVRVVAQELPVALHLDASIESKHNLPDKTSHRRVYSQGVACHCPVYRGSLGPSSIIGPLLVDYPYTTIYVPLGFSLQQLANGSLLLKQCEEGMLNGSS